MITALQKSTSEPNDTYNRLEFKTHLRRNFRKSFIAIKNQHLFTIRKWWFLINEFPNLRFKRGRAGNGSGNICGFTITS
ncbi:MAG: hypothetical protein FWE14_02360 [Lachnospiraceae bacterium]|nr:hypothetical protein [Lachnospiraceae bacterium]